ncbi:Hypothetical protein EHI5A_143370 [Entamoeba histolytica KU27]|nr:Hypothetical protein EHI5A_143370 [Entamoeba histolytica KU27]
MKKKLIISQLINLRMTEEPHSFTEQPIGQIEPVEQKEEILNQPQEIQQPNYNNDIGDIFNIENLKRKVNRVISRLDQAFDVNPVFICLLATAGSIMGGLFVYIVKPKVTVARQFAIQSIIVNGITAYFTVLLGIASIFAHKLIWFFIISILTMLFLYITQIGLVIAGRGVKFFGFPLLGTWILHQTQPSTLLPN